MLKWLWARVSSFNIPLTAAALFASGILHIVATLATPVLAPSSAYGSLAGDLPENEMQLLAEITPESQPLPFLSSDASYALCRFDATDGAVIVSALLPDPGWVVALYSPAGDNFFTWVSGPGRRPEVSLRIVPGHDAGLGTSPETPAATPSAALTVRANEGLALIRAPDRGDAYRARATAELKRAKCRYQRSAGL